MLKKLLFRLVGAQAVIEELEQRVSELANPHILEMSLKNGRLNLSLEGPAMMIMMAGFCKLLKDSGAKNYLEVRMFYEGIPFFMTLQKAVGKTPHELKVEALAERDKALAEVEYLKKKYQAEIENLEASLGQSLENCERWLAKACEFFLNANGAYPPDEWRKAVNDSRKSLAMFQQKKSEVGK